jgi:uncharacterized oxidoreductase
MELAIGKCRAEGVAVVTLRNVDPVKLGTAEAFDAECARFIDFVKSCPPVEENGEVLTPGELEDRNRAQRSREGIELDDTTWAQI